MTSSSIVSAAPADEARVLSVLAMAFGTDPVTRWVLPESHQYLTYFPQVVLRMGGEAFKHGSAYCTDDLLGASLWLPPDVHPDQEGVGEVAERALAPAEQEKVFGVLGQMDEYHPTEPHWYLPFIGVDPLMQGAGYGSALLKHALVSADRASYLHILKRRARAAAGCMSATDLRRSVKFRRRTRRPCGRCSANLEGGLGAWR